MIILWPIIIGSSLTLIREEIIIEKPGAMSLNPRREPNV